MINPFNTNPGYWKISVAYILILYTDVIIGTMASQITSLAIVYMYLTVYLDADQGKPQSSAPLAFVRGIHRWPVNSPHKGPVTRKMFPFDDVIMKKCFAARSRWGKRGSDARQHEEWYISTTILSKVLTLCYPVQLETLTVIYWNVKERNQLTHLSYTKSWLWCRSRNK